MTVFPLKYDGTNTIQDMTASELDRLAYYTQVAYAANANGGGNGYVFVGSGATTIGSASDTSATQQTNQTQRIINNGVIEGYPAYPGIGTETDTTYSYQQDRSTPGLVSSSTFNSHGMLFYDSANDQAQVAAVITNRCITAMRTGNEVGSYRVSASTPSSGGAGTWVDKGTFFTDTLYSGTAATYKLWLKTALDTVPGSDVFPLGLEDDGGGTLTTNIQQRDITNTGGLVQNVTLPALLRKMQAGLYYTVATSVSGENRGAFTNSQAFEGGFYRAISTPSGSASTITTYYLNMIA